MDRICASACADEVSLRSAVGVTRGSRANAVEVNVVLTCARLIEPSVSAVNARLGEASPNEHRRCSCECGLALPVSKGLDCASCCVLADQLLRDGS